MTLFMQSKSVFIKKHDVSAIIIKKKKLVIPPPPHPPGILTFNAH